MELKNNGYGKEMIEGMLQKVTELMTPHPVYLVGGAVRDYLMGNSPKDFDFSTPAHPEEIEKVIKDSGRRAYLTGKKFGTIGCKIDGEMVEITTFRREKYTPGNRKPEVKYVKLIHEDLSRRDFTINAIAIRLNKGHIRIIDPFCGQEDIAIVLIRAVGHPKQNFKEDPLRILRAIRFACRYDFAIDDLTFKKMTSGAIQILNISKERWMMELDKILLSDHVRRGLTLLWITNLFKYMIPELSLQFLYHQNSEYHDFLLHDHTIKVVEATPKDINLRWAALLHDIAKPFIRTDKDVIIEEYWKCESCGKHVSKGMRRHCSSRDEDVSRHCKIKTKSNYVGHEILGADMVLKIARHLKWSKERTESVVSLVKNHLNDDCPLRKYDNIGKKK